MFSDWINRVQKYVVSNTLTEEDLTWNPSTIIRGDDFVKLVSDLRAQPGGYLCMYGSATLVRALLAADLVDELLLTIEKCAVFYRDKLGFGLDQLEQDEAYLTIGSSGGIVLARGPFHQSAKIAGGWMANGSEPFDAGMG